MSTDRVKKSGSPSLSLVVSEDDAQAAEPSDEAVGSLPNDELLAHGQRVADLAEAIAFAMGWGARRRELLVQAALSHDEGKIMLPSSIIDKPGALTAAEFAEVTQHPTLGAYALRPFLTVEQLGWVLHHHERWDGLGYPDGLVGEEIPQGARIIAVADAWDAMTSVRCYRRPISGAGAIAECWRCAGTQFDTEVVRALTRSGPRDEAALTRAR